MRLRGCVINPENIATIQNRQNSQHFMFNGFKLLWAFDKKNYIQRVLFQIFFNIFDNNALTEI